MGIISMLLTYYAWCRAVLSAGFRALARSGRRLVRHPPRQLARYVSRHVLRHIYALPSELFALLGMNAIRTLPCPAAPRMDLISFFWKPVHACKNRLLFFHLAFQSRACPVACLRPCAATFSALNAKLLAVATRQQGPAAAQPTGQTGRHAVVEGCA